MMRRAAAATASSCKHFLKATFITPNRLSCWRLVQTSFLSSSSSSSSSSWLNESNHNSVVICPRVQEAIRNGDPVVALESTIIAHGLPYPQNHQLAQEAESVLESRGVVPATIAIDTNGKVRIGLSRQELYELALTAAKKNGKENKNDAQVTTSSSSIKCSTRELPLLMAQNHHHIQQHSPSSSLSWGATTVASTMVLAHGAGIPVFCTGGIGGVHRDGHNSMDVSTDLMQLSRTPVVVVSAGIKSILDIPRSLQMLETLAVPTMVWKSDEFPAFFSPTSSCPSPWRVDHASVVAHAYMTSRHDLGLDNGMLLAVPAPKGSSQQEESDESFAGERVEQAIQTALQRANERGIEGQALTPFVLDQVAKETRGESIKANMALLKNNVETSADVAKAIALEQSRRQTAVLSTRNNLHHRDASAADIVVVGGAVVDIVAKPNQELVAATSNPGSCIESDGGVGRNIAETLCRILSGGGASNDNNNNNVVLYTAIGNDARGDSLLNRFEEMGGISAAVKIGGADTASYLAILNSEGDLHTAIADMDVLRHVPIPPLHALQSARFVVLDANPPLEVMDSIIQNCHANTIVCLEPTSVPKAQLVAGSANILSGLSYMFPNEDELLAMANQLKKDGTTRTTRNYDGGGLHYSVPVEFQHVVTAAEHVLMSMKKDESHIIVTLGAGGVILASKTSETVIDMIHFPVPLVISNMANATGAGDSFCGAFIAALCRGKQRIDAIAIAMEAATLSLKSSSNAISPELNHSIIPVQ